MLQSNLTHWFDSIHMVYAQSSHASTSDYHASKSSDGKVQFSSVQFGSVWFFTLNLRIPNGTICSIQQFSWTLNGMWHLGSKSIQFMFEHSLNANVSWDPQQRWILPMPHPGFTFVTCSSSSVHTTLTLLHLPRSLHFFMYRRLSI